MNKYLEKIASSRIVKEVFESSKSWGKAAPWHAASEMPKSFQLGQVKDHIVKNFGTGVRPSLGAGKTNLAEGDWLKHRAALSKDHPSKKFAWAGVNGPEGVLPK